MNNQSNPSFFHRWIPTVVGVIIVVLIGGGVIAYQQWFTPQPVELPIAGEKEQPDQTAGETYTNEKYEFEIVLSEGYEGFWTTERTIKGEKEMDCQFIEFYLDASDTNWPNQEFSVFGIKVYPLEKWIINAEIDENTFGSMETKE